MRNEHLIALRNPVREGSNALGVLPYGHKQRRIHVSMRPARQGETVRPAGPKRDFNPLDCLHHQQTKLPVECVDVDNRLEPRVRCKRLAARLPCRRRKLIGQPVGTQTIVSNGDQPAPDKCFIGADEPPPFQKGDLLVYRGRRLVVQHQKGLLDGFEKASKK